jgi:acetyltransferase-like isoleucine patch superfamily enzyme
MIYPYRNMYFTLIKKFFSKIWRILYLLDCKRNGMKYGKNLRIMAGVDFGSEPGLIEIGNNVVISKDVLFSTHDGGANVIRKLPEMKNKEINTFEKIIIGNNVFIGARTIILPGVKIGDNVIIGANSVITKNIESNSVVAGIPAKKIMNLEEYKIKLFKEGKVKNI